MYLSLRDFSKLIQSQRHTNFAFLRINQKRMTSSVTEGKATIYVSNDTSTDVFYNPVQEFNRDMSIAVINQFAEDRANDEKYTFENGLTILEGLSATGLRSIRYAKEIPRSSLILANDFSKRAVETITNNIEKNEVGNIVKPSHGDASAVMSKYKGYEERFVVVDLDPYGSPTQFLDSAVQCVQDGGLLCVTCTDMAVLCGNAAETCYTKYGSVSIRGKNCHEIALRIVLQCIESHANRYGRYIEPLISLSIDFYCRVFVRIFTSQKKCKETTSKLGNVYRCSGCETMTVQRLGEVVTDAKGNKKYLLPRGPPVDQLCKYCRHPHTFGGPFWLDPIHDIGFVNRLRNSILDDGSFGTFQRMEGMLAVVSEELPNVPFYFLQDRLCSIMKVPMGKLTHFRSAILNAGFQVSLSHANQLSIKTNASNDFIWDMMKAYEKNNPSNKKSWNDINSKIYEFEGTFSDKEVDFTFHPDSDPASRSSQLLRFQQNPLPNWGPKQKAKVINKNGSQEIVDKRIKNQGKYSKKKRQISEQEINPTKKEKTDTNDI